MGMRVDQRPPCKILCATRSLRLEYALMMAVGEEEAQRMSMSASMTMVVAVEGTA